MLRPGASRERGARTCGRSIRRSAPLDRCTGLVWSLEWWQARAWMCAVYGLMCATAGLKEVCARAVCAQHGALRAWDHESKSWSLRILAQAPNETALRRAHDGIMSRTTNLLMSHVHFHHNCQDLGDRGTAHADTRSVDSQPRSVWSR